MDPKDKRKLVFIAILSVINGLLGVVGIASILPFIGLISEPDLLTTNEHIQTFCRLTGIASYKGVVIAFGSISLFLMFTGNMLGVFEQWYSEVFGQNKERDLSERLLRNYLHTDVLLFEKRKNSERAKEIISDVDRVILDTLYSMFDLISGVITTIFIIALLLFVNWMVTLVVSVSLILIYLLIHASIRSRLDRLGREYADLEGDIYEHVLEALKLQKEIKLNRLSTYFVRRYSNSCGRLVHNRIQHSLISMIPQNALEIVAYGLILLIAIYFSVYSGPDTQPITLVGMYAFATYRLLPAVADIYDSVENIQFGSAILDDFIGAFDEPEKENTTKVPLVPSQSIGLSNVAFRYAAESPFHLNGLSLDFPIHQMTCIKGKTGCGKSTVLNLIAGLYAPDEGAMTVDGSPQQLYGSASWSQHIGFVPASVNIMRTSLYENIALGVFPEDIDRKRVSEVATMMELDEYIMSMKQGYESVYGENGLTFSSGQIQKIGLARALYAKPSILLLDESTDAFDLETENTVLSRLTALSDTTIIFVSHRPSVLEHASQVVDLEKVL